MSIRKILLDTMMTFAEASSGDYYGTSKAGEAYRRYNISEKPDEHFYQDKFKSQRKEEREFVIDGKKVMAYSRKDAIKRLKHK